MTGERRASGDEFPRGFDGHRRAQAAAGLRLTPAERLRWLEETMEALRRWRGRARAAEQGRERVAAHANVTVGDKAG